MMSLSARLSVAPTVKLMPPAIGCVSIAGLVFASVNEIVGGTRSGWNPPGVREDSHAHPASARMQPAHRIRTARDCGIKDSLLPGAGRHQVVDDVRRDEDQEV